MNDFSKLSDERLSKMILCMLLDDQGGTDYFQQLLGEAKSRQGN